MLALPALLLAATIATPTAASPGLSPVPPPPGALGTAAGAAVRALVALHGEASRGRIERGVAQAAAFWRPSDGDAKAFEAVCVEQFVGDPAALDALFGRLESAMETLGGHAVEIDRELARWAVLDVGPIQPVDPLLSAFEASAHVTDDLFDGKIAFAALLNFPLTTLAERLASADRWTRREWAEVRLAQRFQRRVPAPVNQGIARAQAAAESYIADYNLFVQHLLSERGERLFPRGKRLLSHWNLRDELKAQYAQEGGLARQRALARAMERIVDQTIPAAAVNDPTVDWNPFTNEVRPAPADTVESGAAPRARVDGAREADVRYARILANFRAERAADPYSPSAPTLIARKFDLERELPEARVVALLEEVLGSPELRRTGALVRARLGRPLEPFDVWYDGFRPRTRYAEADLDRLTRARYPTAEAFATELPATLERLGFTPQRARYLAGRIRVDPARGSGHALGASRRGDFPHLRTRVGPDGMDFKGFDIAIHELGHNVEQVFSLYEVDSTLLQGVPNTAFTEAIAFVFQARALDVLGLERPDPGARRLLALNDLWMAAEISGVALVDLRMWQWMYAHPAATPAELRVAVLGIAREIWNRWYAPLFGVRDATLLAIYSHLVNESLYLPDYPIGHLIAAQIEDHLSTLPADRRLGDEIERMASFGDIVPDLWMRHATGAPVSARPLLRKAAEALDAAN